MAVSAHIPSAAPIPPRSLAVYDLPRTPLAMAPRGDISAKRTVPTVGVHWGVVAIALIAGIWFVLAMVALYASGVAGADYLLWIVAGFALIFFALTLGLARWAADDARWGDNDGPPLSDFVEDNVSIATGVIAAREAMIQVLALPVTLALGATLIGIVFLVVR